MSIQIDRETLFATLARRAGGVDPDRLSSAMEEHRRSGESLPDLLVRRGDLAPGLRDELLARLETLLRRHGDDSQSLWSAASADPVGPSSSGDPALVSASVPGAGEGSASAFPRFEPTMTAAPASAPAPAFDPEATSDTMQAAETLGTPDPDLPTRDAASVDPEATSAMSLTATVLGGPPGSSAEGPASSGSSSRFRVVRAHARGGLGSVMVAFDEELRREVALKEIQERHADNPDSRARFLLEAEITGGLEHPGVVPVYSLGKNPDGRPYYAMRFIRGDSLRKAIERFHDPERGPKDPAERSLRLRALLRRFIDVCNAMEYAHSRGVIHRDIKPDNIMLGPYGETLLVDWGLAKAIGGAEPSAGSEELPLRPAASDGSSPTLDGLAVGTPAFMSPEQAEGDRARIGPTADVYSLGATLYAILAGAPAFSERNLMALLRKVRSGDFPRPRQVKAEVAPALEAICLKAMARSPGDRYPSCRALADDLEHWLADEPVSVYREPLPARAFRWARRHRSAVAVSAALVVTVVPILAVASLLIDRERDRARAMEGLARSAVEDMYLDVAETVLADLSDPREEDFLRRALAATEGDPGAEGNAPGAVAEPADAPAPPPIDDAMRGPMQEALAYYRGFADSGGLGPDAALDAARARTRIGDISARLGRFDEAERSYRLALAALDPMADRPGATAEPRRRQAEARARLGVLLGVLGRPDEAEPLLVDAIEARRALVEADPDARDDAVALASAEVELAELRKLAGRLDEAEASYRSAIDRLGPLAEGPDATLPARRTLASACDALGVLLLLLDRPDDAEPLLRRALDIQEPLVAELPTIPTLREGLAKTGNSLGVLLRRRGDTSGAEKILTGSIGHYDRLAADFPGRVEYRRALARGRLNLGVLLDGDGRPEEAERSYREAAALYDALAADAPGSFKVGRDRVQAHTNLGTVLETLGDQDGAGASYDRAVSSAEGLVKAFPDVPDVQDLLANALLNRGRLFDVVGDPPAAEADLDRAAGLYEALARAHPDRPSYVQDRATCLSTLGPVLAARGEAERAEEAYEAAVVLFDALLEDQPESRPLRSRLAICLSNLGTLGSEGSEEALRRALSLFQALADERTPPSKAITRYLGMTHANLGERLAALGRPAEAEPEYAEGTRLLVALAEEPDAEADTAYMAAVASLDLARLRLERGDREAARPPLEQAVAFAARAAGAMDVPEFRQTLDQATERLVSELLAAGRYGEAAGVAAELASALPALPEARVRAAELLDACIVSVEADPALDPGRSSLLAVEFGDRALAQLRVALDAGFPVDDLRARSSQFGPLRRLPAFAALLDSPPNPGGGD